jgi:hypothetical protein
MLPRAAGAGGSSTHNLHAFVCTRPEPFRQLNGPTMDWPYILVILGIAVILYLIGSLRVLRQYNLTGVFLDIPELGGKQTRCAASRFIHPNK